MTITVNISAITSPIYYGRLAPPVYDTLPAIASGGTVHTLAKDVSASGFTLISTEPNDKYIYRHSGHAGSAWDEANQCMWIFGAESHNSVTGFDNSVYRFNVENGLFELVQTTTDSWPDEYRMDANGILWADEAKTRPWGMHSFNRLYYDPTTKLLSVAYDPWQHAYWSSLIYEDPAMTAQDDRAKVIWHFNTTTGEWTYTHSSATQSFLNDLDYAKGVTYVPNYGWYCVGGTFIRRIDTDGNYTSFNLQSVMNTLDHTRLLYSNGYIYQTMGVTSTNSQQFMSIHNVDNLTGDSVEYLRSDFPVLNGWYTMNKCACVMSDGNILFLAHDVDISPDTQSSSTPNTIAAFIFNTTTHTVSDTGHRISANEIKYDWKLQWSDKYNCAIWLGASITSPEQVYVIRI